MEERKFDPYQFIGFILIALILTWMLYRNGPQDETTSNKVVETEIKPTAEINSEAQDSIRILQKVNAYGDLGNLFKPNNYPNIELSTDKMILEIQPRGGAISKLALKEFENFNDKPVPMILDGNTEFNISLNTKDGRTLNTRDFYFTHEIIEKDDTLLVSMKSNLSETQYFIFEYLFPKKGYLFSLSFTKRSDEKFSVFCCKKSNNPRLGFRA